MFWVVAFWLAVGTTTDSRFTAASEPQATASARPITASVTPSFLGIRLDIKSWWPLPR